MPDEPTRQPEPPNDTQALLDFVALREVPCPRCGYNLRGLTQPVCPECGNGLELTVGTLAPINRAWLTLIGALIAPAGIGMFGCVGVGLALQHGPMRHMLPNSVLEAAIMLCVLYAILCIPLSIAAVALRRLFCRLPSGTQSTLATIPVVLDIVGFVFFLALIN